MYSSLTYAFAPSHLIDVVYQWPQLLYDVSVSLTIDKDPGVVPSGYYWSHFFKFQNTRPPANVRAGYTGFQTVKNSKKAIFAIWNALETRGSDCSTFSGEGVGYHCFINYDFQQSHTYQFKTSRLSSDETGDWWITSVMDVATKKEEEIGEIKSPPQSGLIKTSYLFYEYFLNVNSCNDMPFAKITYKDPQGNSGSVSPKNRYAYSTGKGCFNFMGANFYGNSFTISSPAPFEKNDLEIFDESLSWYDISEI